MTLEYPCLVLFACYLLLFGPALFKFGRQLKLSVAVSGVIFFESTKIERVFQFTFMTFICLTLIKIILKMSHMRVQEKQEEKNAFCQIFLSSLLRLFRMQCSSIVIEKFEYYSFALIIFIVNQSVCCSLICLAKLVEHC